MEIPAFSTSMSGISKLFVLAWFLAKLIQNLIILNLQIHQFRNFSNIFGVLQIDRNDDLIILYFLGTKTRLGKMLEKKEVR